jgi:hypothetical protein
MLPQENDGMLNNKRKPVPKKATYSVEMSAFAQGVIAVIVLVGTLLSITGIMSYRDDLTLYGVCASNLASIYLLFQMRKAE